MSSNGCESMCSVITMSIFCDHFLKIVVSEHLTGSINSLYIILFPVLIILFCTLSSKSSYFIFRDLIILNHFLGR